MALSPETFFRKISSKRSPLPESKAASPFKQGNRLKRPISSNLAQEFPMIRGVVGWAPIASPEFPQVLERSHHFKKLKGFRHVVQDEPDDAFLLRPDFNAGIALLKSYGLVISIPYFRATTARGYFLCGPASDTGICLGSHRQTPYSRPRTRTLAHKHSRIGAQTKCLLQAVWDGDRSALGQSSSSGSVALFRGRPRRFCSNAFCLGDWPVFLLSAPYQPGFPLCANSSLGCPDTDRT